MRLTRNGHVPLQMSFLQQPGLLCMTHPAAPPAPAQEASHLSGSSVTARIDFFLCVSAESNHGGRAVFVESEAAGTFGTVRQADARHSPKGTPALSRGVDHRTLSL